MAREVSRKKRSKKGAKRSEKALKEAFEKMLSKHTTNFARSKQTSEEKLAYPSHFSRIPELTYPQRNTTVRFVARTHTESMTGPSIQVKVYRGEKAEREARAQAELARKRQRVGIAYNKGNYVYLSDGFDPKCLGKK
jgi:hypothetical protein